MPPSKTLIAACKLLRKRVQFENAGFRLPTDEEMKTGVVSGGGLSNAADTAKIKEATRLYIESWVLPLIDAIEAGDLKSLRHNLPRR